MFIALTSGLKGQPKMENDGQTKHAGDGAATEHGRIDQTERAGIGRAKQTPTDFEPCPLKNMNKFPDLGLANAMLDEHFNLASTRPCKRCRLVDRRRIGRHQIDDGRSLCSRRKARRSRWVLRATRGRSGSAPRASASAPTLRSAQHLALAPRAVRLLASPAMPAATPVDAVPTAAAAHRGEVEDRSVFS